MPTYDFVCKTCEQTVTITAGMNELKTPKCLKCDSEMTRNYGFSAIKFVGNGFYTKDKNDNS